jgi:hypothetical protein
LFQTVSTTMMRGTVDEEDEGDVEGDVDGRRG